MGDGKVLADADDSTCCASMVGLAPRWCAARPPAAEELPNFQLTMRSNTPSPTSSATAVTLASVDDMRERIRRKRQLKGRQVDAAVAGRGARADRASRPAAGYRRDLLIEYLHRLNDAYPLPA